MLVARGNIHYRHGRNDDARAFYEVALAISRGIGDTQGIASALGSLGNVTQAEGRYAEARRFQEESLTLSRMVVDDRLLLPPPPLPKTRKPSTA